MVVTKLFFALQGCITSTSGLLGIKTSILYKGAQILPTHLLFIKINLSLSFFKRNLGGHHTWAGHQHLGNAFDASTATHASNIDCCTCQF